MPQPVEQHRERMAKKAEEIDQRQAQITRRVAEPGQLARQQRGQRLRRGRFRQIPEQLEMAHPEPLVLNLHPAPAQGLEGPVQQPGGDRVDVVQPLALETQPGTLPAFNARHRGTHRLQIVGGPATAQRQALPVKGLDQGRGQLSLPKLINPMFTTVAFGYSAGIVTA